MARSRHRYSLEPGYELLWYRIEHPIGQGGFGITYLAEDTKIHQHVAIKEYLPVELAYRDSDSTVKPVSEDREDTFRWGLQRFLDEARTLARFRHRNIVRVLFYTEENDTGYVVMEYERGTALDHWIRHRRTVAEQELLDLTLQLLDGLELVHGEGYIHRDIKPANILLRDDGSPVLLDFGAARQATTGYSRTMTAVVSPGYAPIEQYTARGTRQGPWTDIYALGATLYHLIAGEAPPDAIERSVALRGERDPLRPAVQVGAGRYSETFLAAIDRALALTEEGRPQSVAEWRGMLQGEVVAGTAPTTFDIDHEGPTIAVGGAFSERPAPVLPASGYSAPRRWVIAVGAVSIVLAVGMGAWFASAPDTPTQRPPAATTDAPVAPAPASTPASAAPRFSCETVTGVWQYSIGGSLEITAGGTVAHRLEGTVDTRGSWRCDLSAAPRIIISWANGITDTLVPAPNGSQLDGTNNLGLRVGASR